MGWSVRHLPHAEFQSLSASLRGGTQEVDKLKNGEKALLEALTHVSIIREALSGTEKVPGISAYTINTIHHLLNELENQIKEELKNLVWSEYCTKHNIKA